MARAVAEPSGTFWRCWVNQLVQGLGDRFALLLPHRLAFIGWQRL